MIATTGRSAEDSSWNRRDSSYSRNSSRRGSSSGITSRSPTALSAVRPRYTTSPAALMGTAARPAETASSSASLKGSGSMTDRRSMPSLAATYSSSSSRTRSA